MPRWTRVFPITLLLPLGLLFLFQGCDSGKGILFPTGSSSVTLSFDNLEPLSGGLNYQAWLVGGTRTEFYGVPVVLFNMNEEGQMVDPVADTVLTGPFQADLDASSTFAVAVSLEITNELLDYSSYTFILGGEVTQGAADLETSHWLAFDQSQVEATGRFILATPTDEVAENELSGIWFMDPTSDPAEAGLSLPEAPVGWIYEGWVVMDSQPVSVGRFSVPTGADSATTYSGSLPAPTFPGEDFLTAAPAGLTFPPNLSGTSVFISLEPWTEWNVEPETPFSAKVLEAQIPAEATPQTVYEMTNITDQLPTGTATVQSY